MKQQTAVEWLEEKYRSLLIEADFNDTHIFVFDERRNELFRQAKQMEKEQIMNAYRWGRKEINRVQHDFPTHEEKHYDEFYNPNTKYQIHTVGVITNADNGVDKIPSDGA
jgi:hypothetical protein